MNFFKGKDVTPLLLQMQKFKKISVTNWENFLIFLDLIIFFLRIIFIILIKFYLI